MWPVPDIGLCRPVEEVAGFRGIGEMMDVADLIGFRAGGDNFYFRLCFHATALERRFVHATMQRMRSGAMSS